MTLEQKKELLRALEEFIKRASLEGASKKDVAALPDIVKAFIRLESVIPD